MKIFRKVSGGVFFWLMPYVANAINNSRKTYLKDHSLVQYNDNAFRSVMVQEKITWIEGATQAASGPTFTHNIFL